MLGDVQYKEGDLAAIGQDPRRGRRRGGANSTTRVGLGDALRFRGLTELFGGNPDGAAVFIEEALEMFRSIRHRRG